MSKKYSDDKFNKDIKMLEYFQDEFKYRHRLFWSLLVKLFLLDITVIMLPFASKIFGISLKEIVTPYILIFPIFGIIVALFTNILLSSEAIRLKAVNNVKYQINSSMPSKYQYNLDDDKNNISGCAIKAVFASEIVLNIASIAIIIINKIYC